MSVFPGLMRNKSWVGLVFVCVFLLISFETLRRLDRIPRIRDGSFEFENDTLATPTSPSKAGGKEEENDECAIIQQIRQEKITVVLRTGATAAWKRLPIQLLSSLHCFTPADLLLYSDLDDNFGPFHTTDIIAKIPDTKKAANKDFEVYYEIQNFKATKQDFQSFVVEKTDGTTDSKAWTLDKYKFLHVLEDVYDKKGNESHWFVFMEADTYYFWSNLLRWLKKLDSSKPLYFGSVAMYAGNRFGHGGSGFIISQPGLEKMLGPDGGKDLAATWDEPMKNECCGDYVVGLLMERAGVPVTQAWPMLNGEFPESMVYGPGKSWCELAVTMHHIPPQEVTGVWLWEQRRLEDEMERNSPILISDLYKTFISPEIIANPTRIAWDNLSKDTIITPSSTETPKSDGYLSAAKCAEACKAQDSCMQYLWKSGKVKTGGRAGGEKRDGGEDEAAGECALNKGFALGKYRKDTVDVGEGWGEQWISGWEVERIGRWVKGERCVGPKWVDGTV